MRKPACVIVCLDDAGFAPSCATLAAAAAAAAAAVLLALREGAVVGRSTLLKFGPPGDIHEEQVCAVVWLCVFVHRSVCVCVCEPVYHNPVIELCCMLLGQAILGVACT